MRCATDVLNVPLNKVIFLTLKIKNVKSFSRGIQKSEQIYGFPRDNLLDQNLLKRNLYGIRAKKLKIMYE